MPPTLHLLRHAAGAKECWHTGMLKNSATAERVTRLQVAPRRVRIMNIPKRPHDTPMPLLLKAKGELLQGSTPLPHQYRYPPIRRSRKAVHVGAGGCQEGGVEGILF
jgi:hypothetical protein